MRLDWLLVKGGAHPTAWIEPVGAYRPEVPMLGYLQLGQPAQSFQPSFHHRWLSGDASAQNQRMREFSVVVRQTVFEPAPLLPGILFEKLHEADCECIASLGHQTIAVQMAQVFIHADEPKGPGPRRSELRQHRQRRREQLSRHDLEAAIRGTTNSHAKRPERSCMAIL